MAQLDRLLAAMVSNRADALILDDGEAARLETGGACVTRVASSEGFYAASPRENPRGPQDGTERVLRGGSWMCAENFCSNYRVAARSHATPDTGLDNLGFRCARDAVKK